jgi:hypothetical protein
MNPKQYSHHNKQTVARAARLKTDQDESTPETKTKKCYYLTDGNLTVSIAISQSLLNYLKSLNHKHGPISNSSLHIIEYFILKIKLPDKKPLQNAKDPTAVNL